MIDFVRKLARCLFIVFENSTCIIVHCVITRKNNKTIEMLMSINDVTEQVKILNERKNHFILFIYILR
jgi:hypothetical protein